MLGSSLLRQFLLLRVMSYFWMFARSTCLDYMSSMADVICEHLGSTPAFIALLLMFFCCFFHFALFVIFLCSVCPSFSVLLSCFGFPWRFPKGAKRNLQLLRHVIMTKIKVLFRQAWVILVQFGHYIQATWFSCSQILLSYLAFRYFGFELIWWTLYTTFDYLPFSYDICIVH